MASWVNRVVIAAPRNGTTTHTVDPSSATNVVAGTAFTPTAGRLLVLVVEGPVTTTTPAGWTLPTGGSAIANTGLYVFYRTAAGGDSVTVTHNASNAPVAFEFLEFAAGSSFLGSAAATGVSASGGAGPTLSGLTGTHTDVGVLGQGSISASIFTTTWTTGTKATDVGVASVSNDGYTYSMVYVDGASGASRSFTGQTTSTADTLERLVFAVNAAAGGNTGTLSASAPPATASVGGTQTNTATLVAAALLAAVALTGTSTNPVTLSAATPRATASIASTGTNTGTLSAPAARATATMSGTSTSPATLTASTPVATASTTGTATNTGALAVATPRATASLTDQTVNAATLSAQTTRATASITGASTNPAALATAARVPVIVVVGGSANPASLTAALPGPTASLAGTSVNPGVLVGTLPALVGTLDDGVVLDASPVVTGPEPRALVIDGPHPRALAAAGPVPRDTTITGPRS